MSEIELKVLLPDAAAAAAFLAAPAARAAGAATAAPLRSIYFDTPDGRLRAAGLALRLRKAGGRWLQTVKRAPGAAASSGGLFTLEESEGPAPEGRLDLAALPDPALAAAVEAARGDAPLAAAFETAMRRTRFEIAAPSGRVEVAVDVGEVVAGARRAPLAEVEIELLEGAPAAIYEAAHALLAEGTWRFSEMSKAARGHALAEGRPAMPAPAARKARDVALDPRGPAEAAAAAILRECLDQIDANAAACLASPAAEGPHQLRVGLRRLRAALSLFREALGGPAAAALTAQARALAATAGRLRDLDVLLEETLAPALAAAGGPGAAGLATLAEALGRRREAARAALRAALTGAQGRGLLLDLSAFVALRGWLAPADHGQTARLARPARAAAADALERRWRKVRKAAAGLETLDVEGRHALRKELKKLRYGVEFLGPAFAAGRAKAFRKRLKALQESFGALNDAAVAEAALAGPGAPCADDPAAQRAAGRLLGAAEARAAAEWASARAGWRALAAETPFWR